MDFLFILLREDVLGVFGVIGHFEVTLCTMYAVCKSIQKIVLANIFAPSVQNLCRIHDFFICSLVLIDSW